jgi:protein-disulfide isomerase
MQNLKNAMKDYEDRIVLTEIIVDTQELAIKYKFRGSPTILINGKDLEGITEPNEPSLTCRLYANDLPSTEEIKAKIIESLK